MFPLTTLLLNEVSGHHFVYLSVVSVYQIDVGMELTRATTVYWNVDIFIEITLSIYHCESALNINVVECTIVTIFIVIFILLTPPWILSRNSDTISGL